MHKSKSKSQFYFFCWLAEFTKYSFGTKIQKPKAKKKELKNEKQNY